MAGKKNRSKGLRDLNFGPPQLGLSEETKRGITVVVLFILGIISLLSLVDLAGTLGVYLNIFLVYLFGINRWYLPFIMLFIGYLLLRPAKYEFKLSNIIGAVLFLLSFSSLIHLIFHSADLFEASKQGLGSGYIGLVLAFPLMKIMGFWASLVVLFGLTLIGFFLLFDISSLSRLAEKNDEVQGFFQKIRNKLIERKISKIQAARQKVNPEDFERINPEDSYESKKPIFTKRNVEIEQSGAEEEGEEEAVDEEEAERKDLDSGVKKFKATKIDLPLELLDGKTTTPKGGDIEANKLIIKKTLENFGIRVDMNDAQVGPTVTQYTLKPAEGVKLSRITSLGDNLALALAAHPIRIEAPIPGRSLVGIEVPNQATAIVPLGDILRSEAFSTRKSNLYIALGKDVMGRPWLAPLDRMPHLLIAGATGSGKSVCINSLILSLLYQNGPGELKLIMVDPKRVELPVYNGIPHLLTPVITDVKKTVNALKWAIGEMEKRFDILSSARHRNIASYNEEHREKMPYIVIVIDELADLMATVGIEVEAAIVRLAQMSRAVGIHLILATQRPSVDVITGVIKANIPARIAFSVTSLVDSRTILDSSGAEKLIGRGDMLFMTAEISKPKRLQGAYASDNEIKKVIDFLKDQAEPEYVEEVVERQQTGLPGAMSDDGLDDGGDPLLGEAKDVIVRAKKASASLLQRRLRVGYARAARILDLLEEQGVIGPGEGAKPREVLINSLDDDIMINQDSSDEEYGPDEDEFEEDPNEEERFT